jgi:hypothetical protein
LNAGQRSQIRCGTIPTGRKRKTAETTPEDAAAAETVAGRYLAESLHRVAGLERLETGVLNRTCEQLGGKIIPPHGNKRGSSLVWIGNTAAAL